MTPYERAIGYRDWELACYLKTDYPNPRVEKALRDYHDLTALEFSRGHAKAAGELRAKFCETLDKCASDPWTQYFWPDEHQVVLELREQLPDRSFAPGTWTLTEYAIFDGLRFRIAAELYRREHGDYPTSMDQLVPELLPKAPADPFAPEQSLKFDGTHLWSIGWDGEDQQGQMGIDAMKFDADLEQPGDYILWARPKHVNN